MAAPDCTCPHVGRGWTIPRLVALIWRLVADLATARGLDRDQMSQHYVLPDRPYVPVRSEIHDG